MQEAEIMVETVSIRVVVVIINHITGHRLKNLKSIFFKVHCCYRCAFSPYNEYIGQQSYNKVVEKFERKIDKLIYITYNNIEIKKKIKIIELAIDVLAERVAMRINFQ